MAVVKCSKLEMFCLLMLVLVCDGMMVLRYGLIILLPGVVGGGLLPSTSDNASNGE